MNLIKFSFIGKDSHIQENCLYKKNGQEPPRPQIVFNQHTSNRRKVIQR